MKNMNMVQLIKEVAWKHLDTTVMDHGYGDREVEKKTQL